MLSFRGLGVGVNGLLRAGRSARDRFTRCAYCQVGASLPIMVAGSSIGLKGGDEPVN